ncbi:YaaW family protein [Synechocystis sp. PCC 7509]|uniref:YaaW family protein n=1 Tax=Synechocystis sp. PCC 7509 TaxID=927677 RepID=UPI0002AC8C6C
MRSALELATEDELQQLTELLFCRRFNPLDYVHTPQPIDIQSRDREAWLDAIEQRFRYLAADGITVLRGHTDRVTYRTAIIQVCRYLKIPYSNNLATTDLEAEVFLNLLGKAWKQLPQSDRSQLTTKVQKSLAKCELSEPLPLAVQRDPLALLVKGGSAIAVSSIIQPILLQQIARQFALQFASYQVAKEALIQGGTAAAMQLQSQLLLQGARQGMTMTAARYGAVRGIFACMGPVLWTWFFADLGWRSISTNYGRIIPIIFALAQIRLTRAEEACWETV